MAVEKYSQLPTVSSATLADIVSVTQSSTSVQETWLQVFNLFLSQTVMHYSGDPNGFVAGNTYQLCWDSANQTMYTCTVSGTAATAVWTPISQSAGTIIPPSLGGTGVSNPTAHTIPVAENTANFSFLGPLSNGQVLIGNTGNDPVPANLTAGFGISITNSAGGISISASGLGGFSWNVVTGTSQSMTSNNGYIANNAGLVTLTLPLTSSVGDEIDIIGKGSGGWKIAQNTGQSIVLGSTTTTSGITGSLASTEAHDSLYMICTEANLEWTVASGPQSGSITVT